MLRRNDVLHTSDWQKAKEEKWWEFIFSKIEARTVSACSQKRTEPNKPNQLGSCCCWWCESRETWHLSSWHHHAPEFKSSRGRTVCVIYYTYTTANKFCISGPSIYADLCTLWPARWRTTSFICTENPNIKIGKRRNCCINRARFSTTQKSCWNRDVSKSHQSDDFKCFYYDKKEKGRGL